MRISDWSSDVCSSDLAESFAYTLQQAGRATIVGEASGGAANPGAPVATREGLAVFVPTGSTVNPFSGGNWEGTGVQLDVRVPSDRKSGVSGKRVSVRVDLGGRRNNKKKKQAKDNK